LGVADEGRSYANELLTQKAQELAASQQRINELTDKNQNLYNALMNSTAYSDILNEQIKRSGPK
jgi:hypothetical protein